jgi:hypothetical protein
MAETFHEFDAAQTSGGGQQCDMHRSSALF